MIYLTKTKADNPADRPVSGEGGYFACFFGFALGVCGAGGLFSIVRSMSSVRFFISPAGRKSSLAISAARSAGVGFSAFIGERLRHG
jgi:hypothetical protein